MIVRIDYEEDAVGNVRSAVLLARANRRWKVYRRDAFGRAIEGPDAPVLSKAEAQQMARRWVETGEL